MSLAKLRKLDESGVTFQSHIDGARHHLTPERAMEIQRLLGSDIQMQLDECVRLPAPEADVERAMRLSLRWAERCKIAFGTQPGHALFGIVQGGASPALRRASAEALVDIGFDGYALGGLAVGEPQDVMLAMIEASVAHLPAVRPRYLMGVGTPDDLIESVRRGIDMFDCVMPTRAGRHGLVYSRHGRINLRNARHADDPRPIDPESACEAARDLFPRLSAPSRKGGRDPRHDAADDDQPRLLRRADGGYPRGHRGGPLRRLLRRNEGPLGRWRNRGDDSLKRAA